MKKLSLVLLLLSCATTEAVKPAVVPPQAKAPPPVSHPATPTLRLPAGVAPTGYELVATVVPHEQTMKAVTTISLQVDAATDRVWLNQTDLEFAQVSATFNGRTIAAKAVPEKEHFVAIDLQHPIGPGAATLVLETVAPLSRREGQGAFVGEEDGQEYVYTQFESVGARRVFPVFDEPSFKVPWTLTLRIPASMVAVSNTSVETERVEGDFKVVRFERTQPMPSYLLAFGVGPFDVVDGGRAGKNHVPVRIIVPRGQGARAMWAAEMTGQVIDRLEAWFGMPFPYSKADQLAVVAPSFGGAMENPGLVTWSQSLLLSGAAGDSVGRQRGYVSVATHELAHHWFGDLVTAAWWDDLWLNESFADFVENEVLTEWKPDWGESISRVEARDGAMSQDALGTARRIREPIVTHDDIANAFDGITYSKGASVLHMFEHWVGKDAFKAGVRTYLEQHAWKNATATDFLAAISEAAGRDVSGPFGTFLDQPGFPIITASLNCVAGSSPTVSLTQERYAPLGSKLEPELWRVPVCVRWDTGRQCTLLESQTKTLTLEAPACPKWLVANEGTWGYYRLRPVDPALASNSALPMEERVGLAGDVSALVARGELSANAELAQLAAYFKSGNRQLMRTALGTVAFYAELLPSTAQPGVAAFVRTNFASKFKDVGATPKAGEPDDVKLLRPTLFRTLALPGQDPAARAQAVSLVRQWLKAHASVPPEIIGSALNIAGGVNDSKLFDEVLTALKKEPERRARRQMMSLLASVTDPALVKKALQASLDPSFDPRESSQLWWGFSGDPRTSGLAFDFVKAHYDALVKGLPDEWRSGLVFLGTATCDPSRRAEVVEFFTPRTSATVGGPRELANALESMDQCIAWRARQLPEALKFFERLKK